MKLYIALLFFATAIVALKSEDEYRTAFLKFMHSHSRSYSHDTFRDKYQVFKNNLDFIEDSNANNKGFTLGVNKFADLTL